MQQQISGTYLLVFSIVTGSLILFTVFSHQSNSQIEQNQDILQKQLLALKEDNRQLVDLNSDELQKQLNSLKEEIKKQSDLYDQCSKEVNQNILTLKSSIEEIKKDSSQVPEMKSSLEQVSAKINSETFNKIEILGPFYPTKHIYTINKKTADWEIFQTIQSTSFNIKDKAIVTLIATGHAQCDSNCFSGLSFLVDRKVNLPKTDLNSLFGIQFINGSWLPVNFSQVFEVSKGLHEFSLGISYGNGTVHLHALSFVIKIEYVS